MNVKIVLYLFSLLKISRRKKNKRIACSTTIHTAYGNVTCQSFSKYHTFFHVTVFTYKKNTNDSFNVIFGYQYHFNESNPLSPHT